MPKYQVEVSIIQTFQRKIWIKQIFINGNVTISKCKGLIKMVLIKTLFQKRIFRSKLICNQNFVSYSFWKQSMTSSYFKTSWSMEAIADILYSFMWIHIAVLYLVRVKLHYVYFYSFSANFPLGLFHLASLIFWSSSAPVK